MVILIPFMCQMIIKHYICPVLRPRKGISELESTGDSNDCKTGGSVRLYPRIPFALAMGVCQHCFPCLVLRDKTASENIRCCCLYILFSNHMTNISFKILFCMLYINFIPSLSYTSKKDSLKFFGFTFS